MSPATAIQNAIPPQTAAPRIPPPLAAQDPLLKPLFLKGAFFPIRHRPYYPPTHPHQPQQTAIPRILPHSSAKKKEKNTLWSYAPRRIFSGLLSRPFCVTTFKATATIRYCRLGVGYMGVTFMFPFHYPVQRKNTAANKKQEVTAVFPLSIQLHLTTPYICVLLLIKLIRRGKSPPRSKACGFSAPPSAGGAPPATPPQDPLSKLLFL